jgi:hypothetical protein
MAEIKPLPPSASAEGETSALQTQVIEAAAQDKDHVAKAAEGTDDVTSKPKKVSDAGLKNYFVGVAPNVLMLAHFSIARLQVRNRT